MKSDAWYKAKFREYSRVVWSEGRTDRIAEYVHPECTYDDLFLPGKSAIGHEALRESIELFRSQFSNIWTEQSLLIVEKSVLSGIGVIAGIATGPMFPQHLQGKEISIPVTGFIYYEDGLIVRSWNCMAMQSAGAQLWTQLR